MSGSITFTGLGSSLDTASIVSQLVAAARSPETRLKQQQADYTTQTDTLQQISSALDDLKTAAAAIDTSDELLSHSATSSDTTLVDAAAGDAATSGSFTLRIDQLATAQRNYSKTAATSTTAGTLGVGKLTIASGDTSTDFTVDDTTTLASLASDINAKGIGVRANVVSTTDGARLQVSALETGAANAVTYTQTGTVSLGFTDEGNQITDAKDAIVHVDGFEATRSSNTISDLIPGLTLKLKDAEPSTDVVIDVGVDNNGTKAKVQSFVDAYNRVSKLINDQFAFDGTVDTSKLMGDSTLESLQRDMHRVAGSSVTGLSGSYKALAEIGITSDTSGNLSIDSTKFDEALTDNSSAVARVFTKDNDVSGVAQQMEDLATSYTESTTGRISRRIESITSLSDDIDDQIANIETLATDYETQLNDQFTALETLMSTLQTQSDYLTAYLG